MNRVSRPESTQRFELAALRWIPLVPSLNVAYLSPGPVHLLTRRSHGRLHKLSQHTAGRNALVDFATQRSQSSEDTSHGEILQVLLVASESAPGPFRIEGVITLRAYSPLSIP